MFQNYSRRRPIRPSTVVFSCRGESTTPLNAQVRSSGEVGKKVVIALMFDAIVNLDEKKKGILTAMAGARAQLEHIMGLLSGYAYTGSSVQAWRTGHGFLALLYKNIVSA